MSVATTLAELVAKQDANKKYLVTLKGYHLTNTTEDTFFFSGEGFTTEPTDSPANTYFEPRLVEPLSFSRSMFAETKLGGFSVPGFGQIVLTNADGGLDTFTNYAWDGREVEVKVGESGASFSNYFTIFKGEAKQIEFNDLFVNVLIKDNQNDFTVQMQPNLYSGAGGVNGNDDIKGQPIPLCFGQVRNITPVLVDPANRIYQVHDGEINAIDDVFEGGVALTLTTDYTVDLANGRFTLVADPTNLITADVKGAEPSSTYINKLGDIIKEVVITHGGIASVNVDNTLITALNTDTSNRVAGIYIKEPTTVIEVLDQLANSAGAFFGFDRSGTFEVAQIKLATGTADEEFDRSNIISLERLAPSVPNYRIRVGYEKNYTVMTDSDFASGITNARRMELTREFAYETATGSGVQTAYPNSQELIVDTLFDSNAHASAEASRLSTLYGSQRDFYRVRVKIQPYTLKLNDVVKITFPRYNLTSGKLFRVISLIEDAQVNEVELELWG